MAAPDTELHRPAFIQAELGAQVGQAHRVGEVAQQQLGRVAGDQPYQHKHRDRHDQQGRYRHQQAGQRET